MRGDVNQPRSPGFWDSLCMSSHRRRGRKRQQHPHPLFCRCEHVRKSRSMLKHRHLHLYHDTNRFNHAQRFQTVAALAAAPATAAVDVHAGQAAAVTSAAGSPTNQQQMMMMQCLQEWVLSKPQQQVALVGLAPFHAHQPDFRKAFSNNAKLSKLVARPEFHSLELVVIKGVLKCHAEDHGTSMCFCICHLSLRHSL